jgi:F-type H+-transporting ATPase subunit epsilon
MSALNLHIVSPEKEIFSGDVESVTLPGTLGEFGILSGHAPIVSSLAAGEVFYRPVGADEVKCVRIRGGFVEQSSNVATVCVELADPVTIKQKK